MKSLLEILCEFVLCVRIVCFCVVKVPFRHILHFYEKYYCKTNFCTLCTMLLPWFWHHLSSEKFHIDGDIPFYKLKLCYVNLLFYFFSLFENFCWLTNFSYFQAYIYSLYNKLCLDFFQSILSELLLLMFIFNISILHFSIH